MVECLPCIRRDLSAIRIIQFHFPKPLPSFLPKNKYKTFTAPMTRSIHLQSHCLLSCLLHKHSLLVSFPLLFFPKDSTFSFAQNLWYSPLSSSYFLSLQVIVLELQPLIPPVSISGCHCPAFPPNFQFLPKKQRLNTTTKPRRQHKPCLSKNPPNCNQIKAWNKAKTNIPIYQLLLNIVLECLMYPLSFYYSILIFPLTAGVSGSLVANFYPSS